mmetsp:Transcript_17523/g.26448  ORF Transcript_17523/g.26448 Transcript_17523/m.26448 type:complete len:118 (-) Transcript_17523:74-427(-)
MRPIMYDLMNSGPTEELPAMLEGCDYYLFTTSVLFLLYVYAKSNMTNHFGLCESCLWNQQGVEGKLSRRNTIIKGTTGEAVDMTGEAVELKFFIPSPPQRTTMDPPLQPFSSSNSSH